MILYRLMNAQFAVDSIENQRLKVSNVIELNDPSDCAPVITERPAEYDEFPELLHARLFKQVSECIGVICYTESIEDPVVWSHYGDSHRGIALGFELSPSEYTQVKYKDEKPEISVSSFKDEPDMGIKDHPILHTKSPSWSYEKEWRKILCFREKCITSGGMYFFEFDKKTLKEVVLGDRCVIGKNYIYQTLEANGYNNDVCVKSAVNLSHKFEIMIN